MTDHPSPNDMVLRGRKASLRLSILRYQFPQITTGDHDANWLMIEGRVSLDDRSWTFRDPSLTTTEVRDLADWLEGLARGEAVEDGCGFIEPNLQFERISPTMIRVAFALESAPPWAKQGDDWMAHGLDVSINDQLLVAAQNLRQQLQACPPARRLGALIVRRTTFTVALDPLGSPAHFVEFADASPHLPVEPARRGASGGERHRRRPNATSRARRRRAPAHAAT